MKRPARVNLNMLVLDVGGSHVKCAATGHTSRVEFTSGPKMIPHSMVKKVVKITKGWRFDAVPIGYPGLVRCGKIVRDPHNLGSGWIGFDFFTASGCPIRIINDAAMQARGGYDGGKMLDLGLGTGLGSAFIVAGVIAAMELGHLHCGHGRTYEDYVGAKARERLGDKKRRTRVDEVLEGFRNALLPDYIVPI